MIDITIKRRRKSNLKFIRKYFKMPKSHVDKLGVYSMKHVLEKCLGTLYNNPRALLQPFYSFNLLRLVVYYRDKAFRVLYTRSLNLTNINSWLNQNTKNGSKQNTSDNVSKLMDFFLNVATELEGDRSGWNLDEL
jgi:hypothetical protein